ncbi:two-component system KDP operon response regulator KdpE [Alicyclobacillus sacchari]|uniref:Two-component system KDP operon response regulator KdpE n=1 Tax=Alicyclobacillus sacchari TaxID=392010 RepID=A0A4R8LBB6_9BACL|nr:response regulator [Alicyclobacillus sacchari]TDY40226.1 two-component system KDP operon response regulator KdpE [Alicyclobacillus sacchari]GMA56977.1 DNA-binding response regulator [Alicyclobacillus sacchari]
MGAKILIVDDEPQIRKLLRVTLQAHGFTTIEAATGQDGIIQTGMIRPDLIILDLGLPDMDGTKALSQIREWSTVPIIVVTVRDDEEGKVYALDHGADDYVTKPFGMSELMARIRVALRHIANQQDEPVLKTGQLTIDLARRIVERNGKPVRLTPTEYDLLKTLAANAGRVMTHRQLFQQVWKEHNYETAGHYLRVYIGYLRKKIEDNPAQPSLIITEPGVGYRLVISSES